MVNIYQTSCLSRIHSAGGCNSQIQSFQLLCIHDLEYQHGCPVLPTWHLAACPSTVPIGKQVAFIPQQWDLAMNCQEFFNHAGNKVSWVRLNCSSVWPEHKAEEQFLQGWVHVAVSKQYESGIDDMCIYERLYLLVYGSNTGNI